MFAVVLYFFILSFDLGSVGPRCYWSIFLGLQWAVFQLGEVALYYVLCASIGLSTPPMDMGSGACVMCCRGLLYASGLCYLYER